MDLINDGTIGASFYTEEELRAWSPQSSPFRLIQEDGTTVECEFKLLDLAEEHLDCLVATDQP